MGGRAGRGGTAGRGRPRAGMGGRGRQGREGGAGSTQCGTIHTYVYLTESSSGTTSCTIAWYVNSCRLGELRSTERSRIKRMVRPASDVVFGARPIQSARLRQLARRTLDCTRHLSHPAQPRARVHNRRHACTIDATRAQSRRTKASGSSSSAVSSLACTALASMEVIVPLVRAGMPLSSKRMMGKSPRDTHKVASCVRTRHARNKKKRPRVSAPGRVPYGERHDGTGATWVATISISFSRPSPDSGEKRL